MIDMTATEPPQDTCGSRLPNGGTTAHGRIIQVLLAVLGYEPKAGAQFQVAVDHVELVASGGNKVGRYVQRGRESGMECQQRWT